MGMHWLLDCLYAEAAALAAPYWLWKIPQARRYRAGLLERVGLAPQMDPDTPRLWVHAASVGEAGIPRTLVQQFRLSHTDWEVVFSTFTDTGASRLRELYPDCTIFYWPLDFSFSVEHAIRRISPSAVALVEQELWPNFLGACRRHDVPVAVVNGRISSSSARLARGLNRFFPRLWEPVKLCCARSEDDARRFGEAGLDADRIEVTGSLKYDTLPDEADEDAVGALRRSFNISPDQKVLVGGSTHPGEEEMLCDVYLGLREQFPSLRLVLVPRHIERAPAVARAVRNRNLPLVQKSRLGSRDEAGGNEVILVDTIGELVDCYGLADCVFVGRSLVEPGGGQNMMEPAALGKPVLVGPHTGNFEPEMKYLRKRDAVRVVQSAGELAGACRDLLSDPRQAQDLGRRAREAVRESRGATPTTLRLLEEMLRSQGRLESP